MLKPVFVHQFNTNIGQISLYFNERKLIFLDLDGTCLNQMHRYFKKNWGGYLIVEKSEDNYFGVAEKQVTDYLNGVSQNIDIPYEIHTSPFRQKIYDFLRGTKYGEVLSYGDVATHIGSRAYRAVGTTVANNPLPLVIPCHRVVSSDGGIGGFSMGEGLKTKIALMKIEGMDVDRFTK
ncbi:MAG: methylated-DNA--protein-cysteine S-methyltransferase [Oscillospiraceae bacterium]|jgi:O-6-methylguanine DNA methyltransferase|nr:methylated-DNA--protein-cysteine S-methyltransferase [Oscillospiraceae bacterium]